MTSPSAAPNQRIEPADIEGKLRELQGEVDTFGEDVGSYVVTVGAAVVVAVVVVAFWLGRRKGRRHAAVIEIRRV